MGREELQICFSVEQDVLTLPRRKAAVVSK